MCFYLRVIAFHLFLLILPQGVAHSRQFIVSYVINIFLDEKSWSEDSMKILKLKTKRCDTITYSSYTLVIIFLQHVKNMTL